MKKLFLSLIISALFFGCASVQKFEPIQPTNPADNIGQPVDVGVLSVEQIRDLATAAKASNFYGAIALTSGTSGSLDNIDGTNLSTGDGAYVITSTSFYIYYLNASSGASESSPDVISPDDNAGNKRWILIFQGDAQTAEIAQLAFTDGNFIVGNGSTWVAENGATARTSMGVGTGDSPQFTGIELSHATENTLSASGGNLSIEGNLVYRAGGTDVPIADGGTNSSTALNNGRVMISDSGAIVESPTVTTTELAHLNGIASVSTGVGDNDKLVTQGYVDDAVAGATGDVATDAIWDAAGDLVIGTGANTAHRLAAGATTEILVGGGAADPVWTTATGTGAPVRGTSPTIATPAITKDQIDHADDADTLTADECSYRLNTNVGWDGADTQVLTLPTAAKGYDFPFFVGVASAGGDLEFDPAGDGNGGTAKVYLDGAVLADGNSVKCTPAIGYQIRFFTVSLDGGTTYDWVANTIYGVFDDKGS